MHCHHLLVLQLQKCIFHSMKENHAYDNTDLNWKLLEVKSEGVCL